MAESKISMEHDPLFTAFSNGASISSGNANDLRTAGSWAITSGNVANVPIGYGILNVINTPDYTIQVYYRPDRIYVRRFASNEWSTWKSVSLS